MADAVILQYSEVIRSGLCSSCKATQDRREAFHTLEASLRHDNLQLQGGWTPTDSLHADRGSSQLCELWRSIAIHAKPHLSKHAARQKL